MLENIRSSVIRFFDHLDKDKADGMAFFSLLSGLTFLMILSKKDVNITFSIFYVFGNVLTIVGIILSLEIILEKIK